MTKSNGPPRFPEIGFAPQMDCLTFQKLVLRALKSENIHPAPRECHIWPIQSNSDLGMHPPDTCVHFWTMNCHSSTSVTDPMTQYGTKKCPSFGHFLIKMGLFSSLWSSPRPQLTIHSITIVYQLFSLVYCFGLGLTLILTPWRS